MPLHALLCGPVLFIVFIGASRYLVAFIYLFLFDVIIAFRSFEPPHKSTTYTFSFIKEIVFALFKGVIKLGRKHIVRIIIVI